MKYLSVRLLILSVVLTACIDPEETRPYDEFVAEYRASVDAGALLDASTSADASPDAPRDEAESQEQCSVVGEPLDVDFVNATGTTGTLYWIDYECEIVFIGVMEDGDILPQMTFVGHVFRLFGSEATFLGEVVIEEGDTEVWFE